MIKTLFLAAMGVLALTSLAAPSQATMPLTRPEIGKPAPNFTGTDSKGAKHSLSDYKGKIVVLEWTNPGCPFVKKHYGSGDMQKLQAQYTGEDVIWLSVNSSAVGKEGHETAAEAEKYLADQKSTPTARLLDDTGAIGKAYGAKTTPHMFVIAKDGTLAYEGAIDDNDGLSPEDTAKKNYVADAIAALKAGKVPETTQTKPYGCGVKY